MFSTSGEPGFVLVARSISGAPIIVNGTKDQGSHFTTNQNRSVSFHLERSTGSAHAIEMELNY